MRTLFLLLLLCCLPITSAMAQTPQAILKALNSKPGAEQMADIHDRVMKLFGKQNLIKGTPVAKVDKTTVAWAVLEAKPARVVRADGSLVGEMTRLGDDGLQVLVLEVPNFTEINYHIEVDGAPRVGGIVRVEQFDLTKDSEIQPNVPRGRVEKFTWQESLIYPDTIRDVSVYIPQQYKPGDEACLMVWQDGSRHIEPVGGIRAGVVFDNLIHKKEMPVTIGVFVDPGRRTNQKDTTRAANRSVEYDSLGDTYVNFLLTEILPEVQKRFGVKFRPEPESRAIAGGSSGGICAFTAAWERPDQFHKVLSWVSTFVDIRGGNDYPYLLRITEKKPLRVYLLAGENDLDNKFGNWPIANRMMEASLKYMDYDYRIDWTQCFHGSKGMTANLPDALRWLWRDER